VGEAAKIHISRILSINIIVGIFRNSESLKSGVIREQ